MSALAAQVVTFLGTLCLAAIAVAVGVAVIRALFIGFAFGSTLRELRADVDKLRGIVSKLREDVENRHVPGVVTLPSDRH